MKVVGLITEYNPFHNGHLYHIEEAKKKTGADYAIVVMSGNFVQRGAPALMDKYSRTEMALKLGADVVFELPVMFATASAEYFAFGAVSLLHKLGKVDYLCFGSECGDITPLRTAAELLTDEPKEYKEILNAKLKTGSSYPLARMEALKAILKNDSDSVLSSPNNILGIEYMKAILKLKSPIEPVTIERVTAPYHARELTQDTNPTISSATAIRKTLYEGGDLLSLENHVPKPVFDIMKKNYMQLFPVFEDDFSLLLNYKLMAERVPELFNYLDISPDLANRILQLNTKGLTYTRLAQEIKTKQWTLTRINRVLMHVLLNLKKDTMMNYLKKDGVQYGRILGFKRSSSSLLRAFTRKNPFPVLTKLAFASKELDSLAMTMLKEDIFAADLYNHMLYHKFGNNLKDEYTHGVIIG